MAKYSDYAKKHDDTIQEEIDEAGRKTKERRDVPESVRKRFDGKSIEDVLESYAQLEKEKDRLGTTVGQLRQTADQLIEMQLKGTPEPHKKGDDASEAVTPVTVDDLYKDADAAIGRVVEKRTKKVDELEEKLTTTERRLAVQALDSQFPGWNMEVQTEEFKNWVNESAFRQRLAQAADAFDFDAANDLLSEWYTKKESTKQVEQQRKLNKDLDAATLETSSPESLEMEPTFSRHELMQKRIAAHQGDREASEYLRANADAIAVAYEEDRITD